MAVAPAFQGQGIGSRLMDEALAVASALGLQIKLEVHRNNERARRLYAKYGFATLGDFEVMIRRRVT